MKSLPALATRSPRAVASFHGVMAQPIATIRDARQSPSENLRVERCMHSRQRAICRHSRTSEPEPADVGRLEVAPTQVKGAPRDRTGPNHLSLRKNLARPRRSLHRTQRGDVSPAPHVGRQTRSHQVTHRRNQFLAQRGAMDAENLRGRNADLAGVVARACGAPHFQWLPPLPQRQMWPSVAALETVGVPTMVPSNLPRFASICNDPATGHMARHFTTAPSFADQGPFSDRL